MGLGLGRVSMLFVVVETIISQHEYRAISISQSLLLRYARLVNLEPTIIDANNGKPMLFFVKSLHIHLGGKNGDI
jgi:hypothetical protein